MNEFLIRFCAKFTGQAFFLGTIRNIVGNVKDKVGGVVDKVGDFVDNIVHGIGGDKPMTYNHMTPRMNKDLMFQTDTSVYQKLSSSKYRGYDYWHSRCKGEFN